MCAMPPAASQVLLCCCWRTIRKKASSSRRCLSCSIFRGGSEPFFLKNKRFLGVLESSGSRFSADERGVNVCCGGEGPIDQGQTRESGRSSLIFRRLAFLPISIPLGFFTFCVDRFEIYRV